MPEMIDPMVSLRSFQRAFDRKEISLQRGEIDPEIYVHTDNPGNEFRLTYVRISPGRAVRSIAIVVRADPYQGLPVFGLGYAVAQAERKKGLAKDTVAAAIAELRNGMARNGIAKFYVEAIVGLDNPGSQKVAEALLSTEPKQVIDGHSGKAALQYMRLVE